ncbi:MAG: NAD(P)-dependent oxidoreductase [Candidatus Binatia bacterium]
MAQPKILIFNPVDKSGTSHRQLEEAGCQLVFGQDSWRIPGRSHEEEMCRMAEGVDASIGSSLRNCPITRRVLTISDRLRIVAKYNIGVDDVDVEAATETGILVTHCPTEANWGGVAEGTVAMMLALLKKIRERDDHLKAGGWRDQFLEGTYLGARQEDGFPGITVGIVGMGRIGRRVAELLTPWRVRILAYDPYIQPSQLAQWGTDPVDLLALLREADVVTLHVVLTRETRHMIGREELAMMKPSAVLINTSRGETVDEKALVEALGLRRIRAAALDTFVKEPLPLDSPLRQLGYQVLLSPHMGSANAGGGLAPAIPWATRSVLAALRGQVPDNVYNKTVIPRWLERFGGRSVLSSGSP